jgi:hypothetical protein
VDVQSALNLESQQWLQMRGACLDTDKEEEDLSGDYACFVVQRIDNRYVFCLVSEMDD